MSSPFVAIKTATLAWRNGLPFSVVYDDVYHSSSSAIEQSRYVFIDGNDLIPRWQSLADGALFTLAETGFGTGLNFLLSWHLWQQYAPESSRLHFISCEKHPLTRTDLIRALALWPELNIEAQQLIDHYPVLTPGYHTLSFHEGRVRLTLMLGEALDCYEQLLFCAEAGLEYELRTSCIDAWYLDGFAPAKNESMWSEALFKVIAMLSKKGTTLATYTAAAQVKDNLRQQGFMLDKKKGFGPKRHMLSASLECTASQSLKQRHTPWHVGRTQKYTRKSAIIVGAGLAGCFSAYALAKRGWQVTLIDELNEAGKGSSGNQQAVLFPKLSAYNSPLTQLMLSAFLYATRVYQSFLRQNKELGELCGSLLLAYNTKELSAQSSLADWLSCYPELGQLVDAQEAAKLAGIPVSQSGLFIPLSGWIDSPALCRFLARTEGVTLLTNQSVEQMHFDHQWIVNDLQTEVLILANGYKINRYEQTAYLPVKPIRGQMTSVTATSQSFPLLRPLCADGHVLPERNGLHQFGATYELKTAESKLKNEDDLQNLIKLRQLAPEVFWSEHVMAHWAGVRATTPDYLPLVGKVVCETEFMNLYAGLHSNSRRWVAKATSQYPGLYACAGFGSRGLTTVPLCAEWLASFINHETGFLPRNLQQAISPARFLRKKIIRKEPL